MADAPHRMGFVLAPSGQFMLDAVIELARHGERLGYDSIWIPETWGVDAVSILAVLARETSTIRLASGVLNVYSRSSGLIAQTAATLQEMSGGRFILGLGASGPRVVEGWHGVPYSSPIGRTREYVEVIRMALAGERVDYPGKILRLDSFTLRNPPRDRVPIFLAALGPQNVRLAGAVADGWIPIFAARGHFCPVYEEMAAGAKSAGRSPAEIEVAAWIPTLLGPRARRLYQSHIAYYVGAMGTFYADFMARLGFEADTREICQRWQASDRKGAAESVSDRLLDVLTAGMDAPQARNRILAFRNEGVTLPVLSFPHGSSPDEIAQTLDALQPVPRKTGKSHEGSPQ